MKYYVHTQTDAQGDYEVHTERCTHLPSLLYRRELGDFASCEPAVREAKRLGYAPANGCYWCSRACHTS